MMAYPDTSFLVSVLNEDDVHHPTALKLAGQRGQDDLVICEVHLLELPAAVRAATHRKSPALPEHMARRIINRFDRAVNGGRFTRRKLDMAESVAMTRTLGDTHGWAKRHTTFDLWHLAAAWMLSAGAFLTFDKRQAAIARLLGMET